MTAEPISRARSSPVCSDSCHWRWSDSDVEEASVFSIGGSSRTSCGAFGRYPSSR